MSVLTVSQLNRYVAFRLQEDTKLRTVFVRGEIANFSRNFRSGHCYFSVRDEEASVKAVMFRSNAARLPFEPENGMHILLQGSVTLYERDGAYQINVTDMQPDGIGAQALALQQRRERLAKLGYFSQERKRPLPPMPQKIGMVTSRSGAALQDIINITTRRNPYVQIILCPAQVQGDGAAQSIVKAIETLEKIGVDVMIVGRGGGSIEDLWAFNEECVAQAVFDCSVPIISAVGHETDTTIIDFVSDLRAPTPSAAAELAVYSYLELQEKFHVYKSTLAHQMERKVDRYQQRVDYYEKALQHLSPETKLRENRHHTVMLEERLHLAMERKFDRRQHAFYMYVERMKGLSPLEKISGGFGYVSKEGKAVKSAEQLSKGDAFTLYLSDGKVDAQVTGKEEMTYGQKG